MTIEKGNTVRKDKLSNKVKVIKSLAKNPLQTERQVAKDTGMGNATAHGHIKEIEQNGAESNIMDRVLEMDDQILDLVNGLHLRDIKAKVDSGEELTLQDHKLLGDLANNSTKRKAIFGKKDEGDKEITFIIS